MDLVTITDHARMDGAMTIAERHDHTGRGIGRTWVEAPAATTRDEFMTELHAGRVRVGGRQGSYFTMARHAAPRDRFVRGERISMFPEAA